MKRKSNPNRKSYLKIRYTTFKLSTVMDASKNIEQKKYLVFCQEERKTKEKRQHNLSSLHIMLLVLIGNADKHIQYIIHTAARTESKMELINYMQV